MVLKRSAGHSSTCGSSAATRPPDARRTSRLSSGTAATLSATMPPGASRSRTSAEELARREVEGHVRLVVRVHDDQVVPAGRSSAGRAGVRVVHGQARVVLEPEVASTDAADGRIELDAVDLRIGVVDAERARGRPGGVAEDRHPLERAAQERRQRRGTRPTRRRSARCRRPPDRVHGHALVQVQQPPSVGALDDLDVLVVRGLLVQEPRLGLDRAGRDERQRGEQGRDDEVASAQQEARRDAPAAPRSRETSAASRSPESGRAPEGTFRAASLRSRARTAARRPPLLSRCSRQRAGSRTATPCRAGRRAVRRGAAPRGSFR